MLNVLATEGADTFRTTIAVGETAPDRARPRPLPGRRPHPGRRPRRVSRRGRIARRVTAAAAAGCRVLAVPSYTPIEAGPRRTVRRGLEGVDIGESRAADL
ncbi:hypothetical protein [Streptomyces puniciscabiei]|uniref:hypothetical protein n=1 Tax=Streptomyces puniciscabiei TaxID=164348 RepID=UPI00142ED48F|nr:hypothetical protein [Streptomyces puniciscabiei]